MRERDIHTQVVHELRWTLPDTAVLNHQPNEGKRGWQGQRDIKDFGTQAGWPDLEVLYEGRTVFVELKAPKKYPTAIQKECHRRLRAAGFAVHVCRSVAEVMTVLELEGVLLKARLAKQARAA